MDKITFIPTEHQHRRLNPLTGQWILVCPHRMLRPWLGQEESPQQNNLPQFDPNNPLCPGVVRPNGEKNPNYKSTFVFTNDFPALLEDIPSPPESNDPLFQATAARGTCRVMCFHPKSNLTLPLMIPEEIEAVIKEWINQFNELSMKYTWVQIFENKGSAMGCSNPHPHCQIWACSFLPSEPSLKDNNLRKYYEKYKKPMLSDYVAKELIRKERIVINNPDWLVVVPYWASWPFETMIISRNNNKRINDLTLEQQKNLALVIKQLTTKYDNLFKCSFPYSMGFHGAPTGDLSANANDHWTLHAIYYPPLLRSATVRKFMVGFELLCQAQRDLTAEQAAQRLRDLDGENHYLKL
ncbi:galactose-1-phosphate uridylyltransferase [Haematobia irritans]|uniref:galactose-1-phosphate uridylyltransferase n=1 Tax=Haematobia irritans TaxID=7368 RepID=UPI003F4FF244